MVQIFKKTNVSHWYLPLQSWLDTSWHFKPLYSALQSNRNMRTKSSLQPWYIHDTFSTKWSLHSEGTWESLKCKIRIFLLLATLSIDIPSLKYVGIPEYYLPSSHLSFPFLICHTPFLPSRTCDFALPFPETVGDKGGYKWSLSSTDDKVFSPHL